MECFLVLGMLANRNKQNHKVMKKNFYKIQYLRYLGYEGHEYIETSIIWGTWIEAARELIKRHEGINAPCDKIQRKISLFELPNVKRKKKSFIVL